MVVSKKRAASKAVGLMPAVMAARPMGVVLLKATVENMASAHPIQGRVELEDELSVCVSTVEDMQFFPNTTLYIGCLQQSSAIDV